MNMSDFMVLRYFLLLGIELSAGISSGTKVCWKLAGSCSCEPFGNIKQYANNKSCVAMEFMLVAM